MPKINIDELCESIEVKVGGKDYTVTDVSRATAKKITRLAGEADKLQREMKRVTKRMEALEDSGDFTAVDEAEKQLGELQKREEDSNALETMSTVMSDMLGADKADIAELGLRKLTLLVTKVMGTVNEEIEGKNVPKAVPTK